MITLQKLDMLILDVQSKIDMIYLELKDTTKTTKDLDSLVKNLKVR